VSVERLRALPDEEGGQLGDAPLAVSGDDVQFARDPGGVGELEDDAEGAEVVTEHAERVDLGDVPHGREDAADVRRVPVLKGEVRSREEDAPARAGEEAVLDRLGTLQVHHKPPMEDGPMVDRKVALGPGGKPQEHGTVRGWEHSHLGGNDERHDGVQGRPDNRSRFGSRVGWGDVGEGVESRLAQFPCGTQTVRKWGMGSATSTMSSLSTLSSSESSPA
jgi:hypothetical protein